MKRLTFAALALLALLVPARAQLTQSQVTQDIANQLTSCGTGCNTAATLRGLLDIMAQATFQAQGASGLVISGSPAPGWVPLATSGTAATWGQLSCSNLSNATPACSTAIGTSGAAIPLLSQPATVSGLWAFTVAPTVPTQPGGDNSTKAASTAYVDAAVVTGSGAVLSTASPTTLATIAIPALQTTIQVLAVASSGMSTCGLQFAKGTSTPTGIYGEVLNVPSGIYWEPLYSNSPVKICEFGADPAGVADATAAIQAAIDYTWNGNTISSQTSFLRTVLCNAGSYKTTATIYIDPPQNLRAGGGNQHIQYQAYAFVGEEGLPSGQMGCLIHPQFVNAPVFIIGQGNGQLIKSINVVAAPSGTGHGCGLTAGGVGFAVAGGGSRLKFENVLVGNLYYGIFIGYGGPDALADSNSIEKSVVSNSCQGVTYGLDQNFINTIYDSTICGTTSIWAAQGTGVSIKGLNPSCAGQGFGVSSVLTASGVSSPAAGVGGNSWQGTIAPDFYMTTTCNSIATCAANVYNAFTILTAHHGLVPFQLVSYDSGTRLMKLATLPQWSAQFYGQCCPNLNAELAGITTVHAAEMVTVFYGSGMDISDVHLENPNVATTLINSQELFGGQRPNVIQDLYVNADPTLNGGTTERIYAQQTFPFISMSSIALTIDRMSGEITPAFNGGREALIIDSLALTNFIWKGGGLIPRIAQRINAATLTGVFSGNYQQFGSVGFGSGIFERTPNIAIANTAADQWRQYGWGTVPNWGVRPAPYTLPCLTPAQITSYAALPAITHTGTGGSTVYTVSYPLLWGGQQYKVCDWNAPAHNNIVSNHHFYSYGQNLTTTNVPNLSWTFYDRSPVIYMNTEALMLMFPGLEFSILCNAMTYHLMVTEVHYALGYVTYIQSDTDTGGSQIINPSVASCTGTTLGQSSYSITAF